MDARTINNKVQVWITKNRLDSANQGIQTAQLLELVNDLAGTNFADLADVANPQSSTEEETVV